jgi:hypothetical protein
MKRGAITFKNTNSDNNHVCLELSEDGTVWMTKNEIASLFNVYRSSVETSLKSIFKSNGLLAKTVRQEEHCIQTNDKKCIVEYFNLEVIIALSHRLDSYTCIHFRQWIAKQVALSCKKHFPIIVQLGTTTLN